MELGNHRGWSTLKSDAKAAFLQTNDTQQKRQIFGMPMTELQEAMDLPPGGKAAYGNGLWTYGDTQGVLSARGWHSARLQAITLEGGSCHLGPQGEGQHHRQDRGLWRYWCPCG